MAEIQCPHCMQYLREMDLTQDTCPNCAQPLPLWITGPDRLSGDRRSPEMVRACKYVSTLLFALAALQAICGLMLIALADKIFGGPIADQDKLILLGFVFGLM